MNVEIGPVNKKQLAASLTEPRSKPQVGNESPILKRIRKIIAPQFSITSKRSNFNMTKTPTKVDNGNK